MEQRERRLMSSEREIARVPPEARARHGAHAHQGARAPHSARRRARRRCGGGPRHAAPTAPTAPAADGRARRVVVRGHPQHGRGRENGPREASYVRGRGAEGSPSWLELGGEERVAELVLD